MDTIRFDLVTPEATFFSGAVNQVDIPGVLGDFGVLPGHAPVISGIRMGVVKVYGEKEVKRVFVAGGTAEVNALSCTVLAERAVDLENVVRADVEKRLSKAREIFDRAVDETARMDAQQEVEINEALISLI